MPSQHYGKTVAIFNDCSNIEIKFLLLDGDQSYFHEMYINDLSLSDSDQDKLVELLKVPSINRAEAMEAIRGGAQLIVIGDLG